MIRPRCRAPGREDGRRGGARGHHRGCDIGRELVTGGRARRCARPPPRLSFVGSAKGGKLQHRQRSVGSSKSCSLKYQVVVDGRGVALGLVRPRPFLMLQQLQQFVLQLRHRLYRPVTHQRLVPNLAVRRSLPFFVFPRAVLIADPKQAQRPELRLVVIRVRLGARPVAAGRGGRAEGVHAHVTVGVGVRRTGRWPSSGVAKRLANLIRLAPRFRWAGGLGGHRPGRRRRRRRRGPPPPTLGAHLADAVRVAQRQSSLRAVAQAGALRWG